jgi:diguanylate cyclase (GGDEF)-like protein
VSSKQEITPDMAHQRRRVSDSNYNRITLRFRGALESAFQDDYQRKSTNQIRLTFLVGAIFYAAFGLLDALTVPAAAPAFWVLRFGIFMPVSLVVLVLSYLPWGKRHLELLTTFWFVVAGLGILTMIAVLPQNTGRTYYAGLIMVLIAGYTWLRVRLVWAASAGWLMVLGYQIVAIGMTEMTVDVIISNNFFLVGSNVLCMLACHSIERYARRDFLKARLLFDEKKVVAKTNAQLASANVELERLARYDGLTGIPNRREFDARLDSEWRRMGREGKPLALIMGDVDHFKQYNDTYGHQAGDECLVKVAEAIQSAARRPTDLAARYGGEEFALILADTDGKGAAFVAQSVCDLVRRLEIPHCNSSASEHVTLSLGVAVVLPGAGKGPKSLIEMADEALYNAKESGRNRWSLNKGE